MILNQIILNKKKHSRGFNEDKTSEKPLRSVVKALSWRVIGTIDTMIVSWFITGNWRWGLAIGGIEVVTNMILYFFHERVWYKFSKFGLDK